MPVPCSGSSPSPEELRCQRNRCGDLWPRKQVPPAKHLASDWGCGGGCCEDTRGRDKGSGSRMAAGEEGAAGIPALEQEPVSFGREAGCFPEALECSGW